MDTHISFDTAVGWASLARKNVDVLLLVSIGSLGLLPLVSIYIIETEKHDHHAQSLFKLQSTPEILRYCIRCIVYIAILFPYFLALLSTYVSMQLIRGQSMLDQDASHGIFNNHHAEALKGEKERKQKILQQCLVRYQKILQPDDFVPQSSSKPSRFCCSETEAHVSCAGMGHPTNQQDGPVRPFLLLEDCAICMCPFEEEDAVVCSSNPDCVHTFHFDCLHSWMRPCKSQNEQCPCCRQLFFHELGNATTT